MNTAEKSTTNIYLDSITLKISSLKTDLDDLASILATRSLSRHEYHSAERLLQVLVESCIGLSKQWVKLIDRSVPTDAYQAINMLKTYGHINDDDEVNWRKIIGLRNALVHDYLNIDPEIIKSVIKSNLYGVLITFTDNATISMKKIIK